jgi:hypothetical protein
MSGKNPCMNIPDPVLREQIFGKCAGFLSDFDTLEIEPFLSNQEGHRTHSQEVWRRASNPNGMTN